MIEARDVSFRTGAGRTLLRDANATFRAGEVSALVGPNGAGKSTFLKLLAGLLRPACGEVELDGAPIVSLRPWDLARRRAFVPQEPPAFPSLRLRELVSLGRLPFREDADVALRHAGVTAALDRVGLRALEDRDASTLSGGERARASLARALAGETPALLCDEPVAALDPAQALRMMRLFRALAEEGRCVVIVLHDLALATRFCDRLVLMKDAQVIGTVRAAELTNAHVERLFDMRSLRIWDAVLPWELAPGPEK